MRTFAPVCWGEHINHVERIMVDDLITEFRRRSEEATAIEVRRLRDGSFVLFDVKRRELGRIKRS